MRPAATLALFAYNQEDYVRAAIEGAFAQDFGDLEIILSDDCSSDRTFAIMQEMAAAYDGPHRVIARQERPNAGPVQHLINVARAATGNLLVVNAGDDISYPNRVSALHQAWQETGAAALSSWHDEIDEAGKLLAKDISFPPSEVGQRIFRDQPTAQRNDGLIEAVPGFCAAYPRKFWADLPDPPTRLFVEDGLASALVILRGERVHRVPRSLIAYRLLDNSLSNRKGGLDAEEIRRREAKIDLIARDSVGMIDFIFAQAEREGLSMDPRTRRQIDRQRRHGEIIADFWQLSPPARLLRLGKARMRDDLAFLLPRLLGMRTFSTLRIWIEEHRRTSKQDRP